MSKLNRLQLTKLQTAYRCAADVLLEQTAGISDDDLNRSLVFELSAAVGVLRTILTRENTIHEHQSTKGQQIPS